LPENERMDRLGSGDIFLFEGFRLDRSGGGLFRLDQADTAAPVALGSRALDLLGLLVERQGELVSKDAIMETVWSRMVVEEGNLTVHISALRRILDQNREKGSSIQTVPGRGYRFTAPVTRVEPAAAGICPTVGQWQRRTHRPEQGSTRSRRAGPARWHTSRTGFASAVSTLGRYHGCGHRHRGPLCRDGCGELALALVRGGTLGASPIRRRAALRRSQR
jgi:DNA-binding winged helix-turn-helix (wHTH) protein